MLSILSGDDPIEVKSVGLSLYGEPGICKSSLGYSADAKVVTLDFDDGAHRAINRRPETTTIRISEWNDVRHLLKEREDVVTRGSALVLDTVGRCLDQMTASIITEIPKYGQPDGSLTQKGWNELRSRWMAFHKRIRSLGLDLVMISHMKEKEVAGEMVARPDIQGGAFGEITKSADAIGFIHMVGAQRILDFNVSDRWVGKNPARWSPFPIPDFSKEPLFLRTILDQLKAHLNQAAKANQEAALLVDGWRARITDTKNPAKLNGMLKDVNALKNPIRAQVAALVKEHAKTQGWDWDKDAKAFILVPPEKEEEAVFV